MLQSLKSGKNTKEKRRFKCNTLIHNELWNFLKIRVFATNFAVGDLHESYERLFVKKIQHLSSSKNSVSPTLHTLFDGWFLRLKYRSSTNESCASNNSLKSEGQYFHEGKDYLFYSLMVLVERIFSSLSQILLMKRNQQIQFCW